MKKSHLICLAFISCSVLGCQNTSYSTKGNTEITSTSAKAHMLSLSAEDLFYLNQQSPMILQKIEKGESINLDDVINMHEAGVTAESIIAVIDFTHTKFEINTNDVIRLQMEGISFKVINYMIHS